MSDSRFDALQKDPRYRLPSRKEARTSVDPRFKTLFTDQDFRKKATVDRYGRKIKPEAGKKELERLYKLEKRPKKQEREVVGSSEDDGEEDSEEEDEVATKKHDPARDGGFDESSSSEEETSEEEGDGEEDEEEDEEAELADATAGHEQTEDIPMGEVTRRIACVNLDWDNIRAADIMAVAKSFLPASGKVESVIIYPSEFGRERLAREEVEGPPREIFASSKRKPQEEDDNADSESEDDEEIKERLLKQQASEGEEFDSSKLRQYQLERLRYYYAVIECSDEHTAKTLYDAMDGREYLSTSNFFDMRFVPDDTSFEDDEVHDECLQLTPGYTPNDFRTEALTHSKVQLTWDQDDATRKEVQKRAFSRAELDENDLQAYIGSDDSDADSTSSRMSVAEKKKAAKRANLRAALGLGAEPEKTSGNDKEVVGDMQITFTSGLSNTKDKGGVFENKPQDEESTKQRYIRKEKERKQKRKERMKARANGQSQGSDAEEQLPDTAINGAEADSEEKAAKKAERGAKRAAKEAAAAEAEGRKAELELLMAGEDGAEHFDMRDIEKAEKQAKKKGKHAKKNKKDIVEDDFKVETNDPRFAALFESHEYAIDPTNPKFKKTKGMETLLEEGRKKRKGRHNEDDDDAPPKEGRKKAKSEQKQRANGEGDDVKGLVARLKSKNKGKTKTR
ncbi:hypothetical protein CERZMDRAFT_48196 [Cercospora zeae-maydis SCOH1-5]|uniref:Uncharacterized protein n=1 Tax=Cercospora zeae-maydis SCOH1-5 TaxID=717836 RepID=A0A6A6F6T1_9PEZI|nr:hypothetical protein CERZMDRAFT_48196 [Cercospora zeae-maydis SCOH1-5]